MLKQLPLLIILAILTTIAGIVIWQWSDQPLSQEPLSINNQLDDFIDQLNTVQEVITPEPLRAPLDRPAQPLTVAGILAETNEQRTAEGLPPLAGNSLLNQAAQKKIDDMFARQYFEHVAPDGTGPADLVESVGYRYVRVGENLALGNFAGDAGVVEAWMKSPGHRANILHDGFSELGVAVGRGQFEGHTTWLAVQTFALPLASCPSPDPALRRQFEQKKAEIERLGEELDTRAKELEQESTALEQLAAEIKRLADEGNAKVRQGNEEIQRGNEIYEETGDREQAEPYWERGEQLQKEGEALLEQARQKQVEYNQRLESFNRQRTEYNNLVTQQRTLHGEITGIMNTLNRQIQEFNACVG